MSPSNSELHRKMRVGGWTVEPSLNRLSRDGKSVPLQPRVAEVLMYLAGRAGEVATRQEILDAVWQKEFVADNSVSQTIVELRNAFGDDARDPRYIETIPKRGYRLIAAVEQSPDVGDSRDVAATPWWLVVAVAAAVLLLGVVVALWLMRGGRSLQQEDGSSPRTPRIVVLPFDTIGPEDRAYFADGLTEEITCRLARVPGIQVISRTTATHYGRAGLTIDEIGRDLGVDYALEGSVRWQQGADGEDIVRVTPQLIRVADDSHLWTDSFDHSLLNAFAVQAEIGARVLEHLGVSLPVDPPKAGLETSLPDPIAYDAYLHATAAGNAESPATYSTAISWYRRAVEVDSSYVTAWAGLARACCLAYHFRSDRTQTMEEAAREAAARAAEIQPDGAPACSARGDVLYFLDRNYRAAYLSYKKAYDASLDPAVLIDIARVERRLGDWDGALATLTSALDRSPLSAAVMVDIGATCMYLRRYDDALVWFARVGERNPASMMHLYMTAEALQLRDGNAVAARRLVVDGIPEAKGDFWWYARFRYEFFDRRFEQALACAVQVSEAADSSPPRALLEALALARLDRFPGSTEAARQAILGVETWLDDNPDDLDAQMWLALARALAGDREEAVDGARRASARVPMRDDALLGGDLAYLLAVVSSAAGDRVLAIETLATLLAEPSLVSVESLRSDPFFDPIRDDPGFEDLLRRFSAPRD